MIPETLYTKGGGSFTLALQVIELNDSQIQMLKNEVIKKTSDDWLNSGKSVDIRLTSEQKKTVLDFKNALFNSLANGNSNIIDMVFESNKFVFSNHAFDRIDQRILEEFKSYIEEKNKILQKLNMEDNQIKAYVEATSDSIMKEILQLLFESTDLDRNFRWQPNKNFSYKFHCTFRSVPVSIVVSFGMRSVIVTVIAN